MYKNLKTEQIESFAILCKDGGWSNSDNTLIVGKSKLVTSQILKQKMWEDKKEWENRINPQPTSQLTIFAINNGLSQLNDKDMKIVNENVKKLDFITNENYINPMDFVVVPDYMEPVYSLVLEEKAEFIYTLAEICSPVKNVDIISPKIASVIDKALKIIYEPYFKNSKNRRENNTAYIDYEKMPTFVDFIHELKKVHDDEIENNAEGYLKEDREKVESIIAAFCDLVEYIPSLNHKTNYEFQVGDTYFLQSSHDWDYVNQALTIIEYEYINQVAVSKGRFGSNINTTLVYSFGSCIYDFKQNTIWYYTKMLKTCRKFNVHWNETVSANVNLAIQPSVLFDINHLYVIAAGPTIAASYKDGFGLDEDTTDIIANCTNKGVCINSRTRDYISFELINKKAP